MLLKGTNFYGWESIDFEINCLFVFNLLLKLFNNVINVLLMHS
jgi:hypothetical protein